MNNCVLLRYGEVGIKSKKTRIFFERNYIKAIKDALEKGHIDDYQIENLGGRFIIFTSKADTATIILKRVAGIHSVSPAFGFSFSNKDELEEKVLSYSKESVKNGTFGVRVKRIGAHEFTSNDIAKEIGGRLKPASKGVSLKNPDVTVSIEIRKKQAFVFTQTFDSVGGLPMTSNDRVLCLFSGGIDSPVAAFEMIKRGTKVDFLFVNITDEKLLCDVSKVYDFFITQFCFGYTPRIYVVDGREIVQTIRTKVKDSLRQIAYKVALYTIAGLLAKKERHSALVTGESLAQKSSQTLQSLIFLDKYAIMPIFRPLLCFDKTEIMKIARTIGTFSTSEKIKEYCGLSNGPVTTNPSAKNAEEIPSFVPQAKTAVENVSATRGVLDLPDEKPTEIPKSGFISIDIRPQDERDSFPLSIDNNILYADIQNKIEEFEKGKFYVFICRFGVLSEEVAFMLRKKGIDAAGMSAASFAKYFEKK